jgi:hypothetical protein
MSDRSHGPVPTLGYRSKSEAAAALRAQGLSHAEIGCRLGVAKGTVGSMISTAKRGRNPLKGPNRPLTLTLSAATWHALEPAAVLRGVSIERLAGRLLAHVAADQLVNAILDDGEVP